MTTHADTDLMTLQYRETATLAAKAVLDAAEERLKREARQLGILHREKGQDRSAALARNAEQLAALKPVLSEVRKARVAAVRAIGNYHRKRKQQR